MENFLKGRKATQRAKMPEIDREKALEALKRHEKASSAKDSKSFNTTTEGADEETEETRQTTELPAPEGTENAPRVRLVSENGILREILLDLEDGRHLVFEVEYAGNPQET
jgi:hypothetical protein